MTNDKQHATKKIKSTGNGYRMCVYLRSRNDCVQIVSYTTELIDDDEEKKIDSVKRLKKARTMSSLVCLFILSLSSLDYMLYANIQKKYSYKQKDNNSAVKTISS